MILLVSSTVLAAQVRLEIKEINTNPYSASRIFGLAQHEGEKCGPFDIFWCPKFGNNEEVYVTELRFVDGSILILNLTQNENETLISRANNIPHAKADLSSCAQDDLPYGFTCRYKDVQIVR